MSDLADESPVSGRETVGTDGETLWLDGNAAAGLLAQIFMHEMTSAESRCAQCGATAPLGSLLLYGGEMGSVLRCPGCDHVQMRIAEIPERGGEYWIDMQGLTRLRFASSAPV